MFLILHFLIDTGSTINLGVLAYRPPRNGPTLWEIGAPDRSAAEFFVPDPDPKFLNHLLENHAEKFRQYGLWARYTEIYRYDDLKFTIGVSNYAKDWFFAHVTRYLFLFLLFSGSWGLTNFIWS